MVDLLELVPADQKCSNAALPGPAIFAVPRPRPRTSSADSHAARVRTALGAAPPHCLANVTTALLPTLPLNDRVECPVAEIACVVITNRRNWRC